jgi:hypothetical protein
MSYKGDWLSFTVLLSKGWALRRRGIVAALIGIMINRYTPG